MQTASGIGGGPLDFKVTFFPDHDGDGVLDGNDDCLTLKGVQRFGGCPPEIVPMFALALVWMRRSRLGGAAPRPSAWGWAPIIAGAASQLAGGYFHQQWFDGLALLPYLAGLALLFGGWRHLGWAWPSIAFLASFPR